MQSTRADSDEWIRSGIWCNQTMDQGRAEDLRSSPHEIMQFSMSTFSDESGSIPSYDIHIFTLTCTELIQAREYQADLGRYASTGRRADAHAQYSERRRGPRC
eukprot:COSAG02_NODE_8218_length_2654_cov_1.867710_2_plen_103_part_00